MNVSLVDTSAVSTTAARPGGSSRLMRPEQTVSSTEWRCGVELETKFSQSCPRKDHNRWVDLRIFALTSQPIPSLMIFVLASTYRRLATF